MYPLPKSIELIDKDGLKLAISGNLKAYRVLDAPCMPGKTLGSRRLQYTNSVQTITRQLYKISKPIFNYAEFISSNLQTNKFIDSFGTVFNYTKSFSVPLTYHKIKSFIQCPTGYVLKIHNIHTLFLVSKLPDLSIHYVGLLEIGKGYVLYEFSKTKKNSTRRKI